MFDQLEIGSASDVGRKRKGEPNQDSLEIIPPISGKGNPPLFMIADGMGGHVGGAIASQNVIENFKNEYLTAIHPATDYLDLMKKCLEKAHQSVRQRGATDIKLANMGSTLVSVVWGKKSMFILNVGDSRAYLIRNEKLIQISEDQSWVAEQIRAGILTKEQAIRHPARNRLSMAITAKRPEVKPYVKEFERKPDDILVLCSDGLWGVVPESLILAAALELDPKTAVEKLIAKANGHKGPDNISIIIVRQAKTLSMNKRRDIGDTNPGF